MKMPWKGRNKDIHYPKKINYIVTEFSNYNVNSSDKNACNWFDLLFHRKCTPKKTLGLSEDFSCWSEKPKSCSLYLVPNSEKTLKCFAIYFGKESKEKEESGTE